MANLAAAYLDGKRWTEAEITAREYLDNREKIQPDDWTRFQAMSLLGAACSARGNTRFRNRCSWADTKA